MECYKPALLWYKKFRKDLEAQGFKFNPYDPCVANWKVKGSQHTILFHVNDLKCSHRSMMILQNGLRRHMVYLVMKMDYSEKKKLKIDMRDYVKGMSDRFPIKFKKGETAATPAGEDIFGQMSSNYKN